MKRLTNDIPGVSDSTTRIAIWDKVPGNSVRSKTDDMEIEFDVGRFRYDNLAIVGTGFREEKKTIDSYTYHNQIMRGFTPSTYYDEPYIIPYVVGKRRPAVLVIPGGGFICVTSDGAEYEGKSVALELNERGFSAFVLHYRVNPYRHPLPLLDVQRAVRFIRSNSDELGVDPALIALIGFSAGGYEIAGFLNLVRSRSLFPADYIPDETDSVDDGVFAAGLVYPVVNYRYNVPMLFASYPSDKVRDPVMLEQLLDASDAALHYDSADVSQFVTYSLDDSLVDARGPEEYIRRARLAGTDVTALPVVGQEHGYGRIHYFAQFLNWLEERVQNINSI